MIFHILTASFTIYSALIFYQLLFYKCFFARHICYFFSCRNLFVTFGISTVLDKFFRDSEFRKENRSFFQLAISIVFIGFHVYYIFPVVIKSYLLIFYIPFIIVVCSVKFRSSVIG